VAAALLFLSAPLAAQPRPGAVAREAPAEPVAGRFTFKRYTAPVPADWQPLTPSSSFRAAQYRVPAAPGAGDAEAVVFYFGPGQGGPVQANIERWVSQFTRPDGQPVKPRVRTLRVDGMPATIVELAGTYARGVGMGPVGSARPGQVLLAAVVETPDGNLTFQLHGDRATVERHREGFERMVGRFEDR
jgi:hypothetical protein